MARRGRRVDLQIDDQQKPSDISYLQPEILPLQVMLDVLKERGMISSSLQQASRAEITKLFYKHVSPKYQRVSRDNRRGRIVQKARRKMERKVDEGDWKRMVMDSSGSFQPSLGSSGSTTISRERLKPPLSCISTDKKVIKLGHSTKCSNSDLNFVIKRRSSNEDLTTNNKKAAKDEPDHTEKKRKSEDETDSTVKRTKRENGEAKPLVKKVQEDGDQTSKSGRKAITWP